MRRISSTVGYTLIVASLLFLFIHTSLVTATKGEDFSRDLFGLPIPHPPVWTSYIPILGYLLGIVFEFFSLHGLVGLVIAVTAFGIGGFLIKLNDKNEAK